MPLLQKYFVPKIAFLLSEASYQHHFISILMYSTVPNKGGVVEIVGVGENLENLTRGGPDKRGSR